MPGAIPRIVCCVTLVVASAGLAQQGPVGPSPGQRFRPARPIIDVRSDLTEDARRSAQSLAERLDSLSPERRAEAYLADSERHRAQALALARLARCGAAFPSGAAVRLREALRFDLHSWRDAFQVTGGEWEAIRDAWLLDRRALTARQWAERRALWFQARDAWIAGRREQTAALRPESLDPPRLSGGACAALALGPAGSVHPVHT